MTPKPVKIDSMRARMTTFFVVGIAFVSLLSSAALTLYVRHLTHRQAHQLLEKCAQQVRHEMHETAEPTKTVSAFVEEQNEDLQSLDVVLFAVDKTNRIVARPSTLSIPPWPLSDDSWQITTLPHDKVRLILALPWTEREQRTRQIGLILLALSSVVICASAAGAWLLVGRTLSPIDRLASQAHAVKKRNQIAHLESPSNDREITHLVATLNELLEYQAATAAARGRFYAAASHELRTPLQALQGHLELALGRPREAAQYHETIVEADAQARRLSELVQSLLFLNQLEMASARPPAQEADLADICARFLTAQRAAIESKNLQIESTLPDSLFLSAPGNHPEVLLRNLLENALKYTPDGGQIHVLLSKDALYLEIFNQCTPLGDETLQRLCEPFFRPDVSRHSQTGGNGLGLAICKAICEINNWNISLKSEDTGLIVRVDFSN